MPVIVCATPFDPWTEISRQQASLLANSGKYGATAAFVGTLRDFNQGDTVQGMTLEHYPGMTEKFLHTISEEAHSRWEILDSLLIHRFGLLAPNDPIMLMAVWSAHRAAAFDACRYLVEQVKHRAPFWKQEQLESGTRWVASNTPP